jgi:hypothetical protein
MAAEPDMKVVEAWLLGVFYGAARIRAHHYTNQNDFVVRIAHRKEETNFKGEDKSGAIFLNIVDDAIGYVFSEDSELHTNRHNNPKRISWNDRIRKLILENSSPGLYDWALNSGVRSVNNLSDTRFPVIDARLIPHFLRGFLESNGGGLYLYTDKKTSNLRYTIEFKHKSKELIEDIRTILNRQLTLNMENKISKNKSIWVMRITSKKKAFTILKYLYESYRLSKDDWEVVKGYHPYILERIKEWGIEV